MWPPQEACFAGYWHRPSDRALYDLCWSLEGGAMAKRSEMKTSERRTKKKEKKVKKWKAWTAEPREEVRQRLNWVQHVHQEIVQIREVLHPLGVAVKTLDAQVNDLISTWLAQNDGT
ncbi:hypothetical protein J1N35_038073 [Gossypium stocksii]|uniref:Uncharacterized protein n=1 Tax=Gossypium stocksii TaxID=47602 RepID=A0A9D3ULY4_9ROSI|nr:hypothetical protein J1N35_038073 [Gossypium stocksii]